MSFSWVNFRWISQCHWSEAIKLQNLQLYKTPGANESILNQLTQLLKGILNILMPVLIEMLCSRALSANQKPKFECPTRDTIMKWNSTDKNFQVCINLRFFLFALGTLNSVVLSEEKVTPVDAVFETTFRCLFSFEEIISEEKHVSMKKVLRKKIEDIPKWSSCHGPWTFVSRSHSINGEKFWWSEQL